MDVASLASGLLAARMGEVQLAVAAKLARMNAQRLIHRSLGEAANRYHA